MKIIYTTLITLLLSSACFAQKLYLQDNYARGILDQQSYDLIKAYLEKENQTKLKDTIIIKYNFAGDDCWGATDALGKKKSLEVIESNNNHINAVSSKRPNVSIFEYRQKGNNQNNVKLKSPYIKIDNNDLIKNLLFKEKTTCGTSIIILPNRRCLIIKSDAHFNAINLSTKEINVYINI